MVIFFSIIYLQKIKINKKIIVISCLIGFVSLGAAFFLEKWIAIIVLFGSIVIALLFYSDFFNICLDLFLIIMIGLISSHVAQIILGGMKNIYIYYLLFVICYIILFTVINVGLEDLKKIIGVPFSMVTKFIISLLATVTVIVLYLNIFIPTTFAEKRLVGINLFIQICYLVIVTVSSILLIYSINRKNELKQKEMQQSLFSQYMSSLEQINLDMQKFRHDYTNILLTMERYIEEGDLERLKGYFYNKIVKTGKNTLLKNHLVRDLGNLEIIELKGLLLTKLLLAVEKNIHIQIEISEKVNRISMDIIDLSRIIGIFVDNAIEAAVESPNPFVNLAIIKTSNDSVLIVIENSYQDDSLDVNRIYKNHNLTRKGKRGYGLKTVSKILNNYPNVLLHTSNINHVFTQELEILEKGDIH